MTNSLTRFLIVFSAVEFAASAAELLSNTSFEGGNLNGWTANVVNFSPTNSCSTTFTASTTNTGCANTVAPVDGLYDAFSAITFASNGSGEIINDLTQSFVVPSTPFGSAFVTWDATTICTSSGTPGCAAIVQLYSGACAPCTGGVNFIDNHYLVTNAAVNIPWTSYNWNITSDLAGRAGQTVTLELTVVAFPISGSTSIAAAFDNVAVITTPEPSTLWTGGVVSLLALGTAVRKRRRGVV